MLSEVAAAVGGFPEVGISGDGRGCNESVCIVSISTRLPVTALSFSDCEGSCEEETGCAAAGEGSSDAEEGIPGVESTLGAMRAIEGGGGCSGRRDVDGKDHWRAGNDGEAPRRAV